MECHPIQEVQFKRQEGSGKLSKTNIENSCNKQDKCREHASITKGLWTFTEFTGLLWTFVHFSSYLGSLGGCYPEFA
ncbi:MAG: hypothetical protein ACO1N7_13600 [Sphingobacteriaceae bacterium]